MTRRAMPHSGACRLCGALIIDAIVAEHAPPLRVVLDARDDPEGPWRAYLGPEGWVANPYAPHARFGGMRRREHTCPDTQLTLDEAE